MMVVIGTLDHTSSQMLVVNDPSPVRQGEQLVIPYGSYVKADDHSHWDDFYEIRRKL
jgi:hypothetical protein